MSNGSARNNETEPNVQSSKPPLKNSPGFLMIESAAKLLISSIGRYRQLIDMARKDSESTTKATLRPYEKRLEPRERVAIEAAMTRLDKGRLARVTELIQADNPEIQSDDRDRKRDIYPLALEQVTTTIAEYTEKAEAAILSEIYDMYGEKDVQLAFASNYYVSLRRSNLTDFLAQSILLGIVRDLKDFIGSVVRNTLFTVGSDVLGELPPVPSKVIQSYSDNASTRDLKRWMNDRRAEEFVRGGPVEWRASVLQHCGVDLDLIGGDWQAIRESVARSELISRSLGKRIDAEYLEQLTDEQRENLPNNIIDSVVTDAGYIESLLSEIETAAPCLMIRWCQRFMPDPSASMSFPLDIVVRLERDQRWHHARSLCESMLDTYVHSDHPSFNIVSINRWFCEQQLGDNSEVVRQRVANIQATSAYETMGKAALLRDWPLMMEAAEDHLKAKPRDAEWVSRLPLMRRAAQEYPDLRIFFAPPPKRQRSSRSHRRR